MQLMTKEIERKFAQIGSQENVKDPIVVAHYFNPAGAGDWYATEYDPKRKMFFGYVSIFKDWNDEWGSFTLQELESFKGFMGLGIERDLYFDPKPIGNIAIPSLSPGKDRAEELKTIVEQKKQKSRDVDKGRE